MIPDLAVLVLPVWTFWANPTDFEAQESQEPGLGKGVEERISVSEGGDSRQMNYGCFTSAHRTYAEKN